MITAIRLELIKSVMSNLQIIVQADCNKSVSFYHIKIFYVLISRLVIMRQFQPATPCRLHIIVTGETDISYI